ncbi:ecto-ADP-ribosyltransferase 5-like [Siphateles boraxobius]|uniref:ecto-ADP-ribosyltransferase 5-like n=1 Tax=Siphateles boraxobius TaxID=180520 RepID=UPI004063C897
MLLIIEALLISAVLGQDHRNAVEGQIFPLDMAENSVDDQFYWCLEEMEHRVQTEFLKKEMMSNSDFATVWTDAVKNHNTPGDNLSRNHSVAIYAYTNSDFTLYQKFNDAVRTEKQKYKYGTYSWYSLHFWLTEAIQILKKTQSKCYNTYRGTGVEFDKNVTGKEVRFGQFASSTLDRTVAEGFGHKSCFEIYTCEGADLTKYSKFPEQKEVLIPPYETFIVSDVKTRVEQKDLWCDTVFTLKSYNTRSSLNCAVSNSGNQVAFFNVLLILIIFCNVFLIR